MKQFIVNQIQAENGGQMSNWIKLLPLELHEIEEGEFCEPETGPESGKDNIVGEMSIDLKRIYTRYRTLRESADRAAIDAKYAKKEEQRKEFLIKALELHEKAEAMESIFWISVKDEFGLWGKESIGVRKGFLVVWSEAEAPKSFIDFLRGMQ